MSDYDKRAAVRGDSGGPDFTGLLADLQVAVGRLTDRLDKSREAKPQIPVRACHPVPILGNIKITASAGQLGPLQQYGPNDGFWWDLKRLSVWGFTAGTVTVFLGSTAGEQVAVFSTAGEFTWSGQKLLAPNDELIWVAAGITLAAGVPGVLVAGQAVEVLYEWLPEYLM